jgi:phage tail sheath gpL-like
MISFDNVSQAYRASKIFIELQGVQRTLASLFIPPTGMIVGQYDPLKTSVVDYAGVKVSSAAKVGELAGFGSHAHRQALRFPAAVFSQGGGVYWFPVPEGGGATAATDTITITGTATSAGTLFFLIGGELVQVGVAKDGTATAIGDALVTAITAIQNISVTAVNAVGVVTVTAKFKGTAGNQILQVINPGGETQEDVNPAGVTVALGNVDGFLSGGATDPDVHDVFFDSNEDDVLGDRFYTACTMPYTDQANIDIHKASAEGRFDPSVNRFFASYGGYIKETYSAALALPAATNSQFIGQIWENRSQAPAFELAAALVGTILDEQNQAPNRPYKTIETGIPIDDTVVNRKDVENDALFRAGMSYCYLDSSDAMRFGDIALTYRTNAQGAPTEEWFDAVSLHTRQAKAYSVETMFKGDAYERAVVVSNTDVTSVDYAIAPKDVVADISKLIQELWGAFSWSKNIEDIIAGISAEINTGNNSRIDSTYTDDEAKALRIIAVAYKFLY